MISNQYHGYFLRSQQPIETTELETAIDMASSNLSPKPDPFTGLLYQDAAGWYVKFQAWLALSEWTEKLSKVANGLRLMLLPSASTWFSELDSAAKEDVKNLDTAFSDRFVKSQPCWVLEQQLWSRVM